MPRIKCIHQMFTPLDRIFMVGEGTTFGEYRVNSLDFTWAAAYSRGWKTTESERSARVARAVCLLISDFAPDFVRVFGNEDGIASFKMDVRSVQYRSYCNGN